MKRIKKWVSVMLALSVMISLLMIPAQETQASTKASVTKAVHLNVGSYRSDAIFINFVNVWDHVENLKTNSKNLKAKVTNVNISSGGQQMANSSTIALYASKEGTYTVSFDICNADDEKVSSHIVTVYVNTDMAIESATIAGMPQYCIMEKTKGKLVVKMNEGYTLKKIVLETYDKTGKTKTKTVKNNSVIELGKYPFFSESGEKYEDYYNMNTSLLATTSIRIYYIDKYTKEEMSENYYMYRLAE